MGNHSSLDLMRKSVVKKLFVFVLFALLTISIYAKTYVINDYHFEIDGKTQKRVVKDLIIPEGDEVFSSEEGLLNSLAAKRQTLINRRLFKTITYDYEIVAETEETIYVDVNFIIVDAKSFIFVPYPKYDSNSGTTINAKVRDKNLMGTLATLDGDLYALFRNDDWKNPEIKGEFNITKLLIGDTSFSIKLKTTSKWGEKDPSYYYLGTTVTNIPFFFNTWFNLDTYVEKYGEGSLVKLSSTYNGIKFNGIGITPSISSYIYTTVPSANYLTPAVSVSGINLWGNSISLSSSVKFMKTKDSEYKSFAPVYFEQNIRTYFGGEFLKGVSHATTVKYTPKTSIDVLNSMSYALTGTTTIHLLEDIYMNVEGDVKYFDTGVGISQNMTIGKNFTITPKLCEYLRSTITETGLDFSRFYTLSATSSKSTINWNGNFREGFAYKVSISETWNADMSSKKATSIIDHVEFTYFKLFGNWFNPSFRVIFNQQINNSSYGYIFSTTGDVGEQVRGVLNKNIRSNNQFAAVFNMNLLTVFPMPKLFDFADYYASVFFDCAVVKANASSEFEHYYGFGVEGVGIFKEYPSYPIRLSIGFDLERLSLWLKDEGPSNFYEIFFGLDFFF